MALNLITKTRSLVKKLKHTDGENIIEVYRSGTNTSWIPADTQIVTGNSFLKNFRLFCKLNDEFPKVELPDIEVTDTRMQQIIKTVDVYWKNPRKQLNIYLAESGTDWVLVGQVSLVSINGYPYQLVALMDTLTENIAVELGMDSAIGVSVTAVNHGGMVAADTLNLFANVAEEYLVKDIFNPITYTTSNTIIGTTPIKILPPLSNRKTFRITNQSNSMVFLSLSENTNPVFGIQLQPNGDYYHHSEQESRYLGSVWAQSWAANSNLLIMEGI